MKTNRHFSSVLALCIWFYKYRFKAIKLKKNTDHNLKHTGKGSTVVTLCQKKKKVFKYREDFFVGCNLQPWCPLLHMQTTHMQCCDTTIACIKKSEISLKEAMSYIIILYITCVTPATLSLISSHTQTEKVSQNVTLISQRKQTDD